VSPFDVVSATRRLELSGKRFAADLEYAEAISRGKAGKFTDALMTALGEATAMSAEDTCAIAELYRATNALTKSHPQWPKLEGKRPLDHQQ
jgi:hypothetical protein